MTTFYLDPVGGSDAAAGTSFATRWQTFTSGATAGRITAGDTIRVIASPDPTSMAQNATFTFGSQQVALTTAVNADIYTSATWTAATANVTLTTSTNRRLGAASVSISPAAAFTTGKAAYKTITSTDFSAYQQVSFSICMTAGTMAADGDIYLALCSDTLGATVVNTINVPRIRATSQWQAYTVDLGTNLGSAIQSVALYVAVDNGAQTFLLNNIIACKASSSADSLSLTSHIGINTGTEPWYPILSITGTTIQIQSRPQANQAILAGNYGGYLGTTTTQTIYKRDVIQLPSSITASTNSDTTWGTIQQSGSAGSPITFSGGWNRTDMSTQTGNTYISGVNNFGYGISSTSHPYVTFDKINLSMFFTLLVFNGSQYTTITAKDWTIAGSGTAYTAGIGINNTSYGCTFNIDNLISGYISETGSSSLPVYSCTYNIINYSGILTVVGPTSASTTLSSQAIFNQTYNITNWLGFGNATNSYNLCQLNGVQNSIINITNLGSATKSVANPLFTFGGDNSSTIGSNNNLVKITGSCNVANPSTGTASNTIIFANGNNNVVDFNNLSITIPTSTVTNSFIFVKSIGSGVNNVVRNVAAIASSTAAQFNLVSTTDNAGATLQNVTVTTPTTLSRVAGAGYGYARLGNYQGVITDQRTYYVNGSTILSDTSTRHTASGISWKMTPSVSTTAGNPTSNSPLSLPVATIACNASALVTASVWVYRTSTSVNTSFVCPGGQISGVSSDVVATAAAAINTWEQLTITFTPSQQGVVQLYVQCYGAAADIFVDDFAVSQA